MNTRRSTLWLMITLLLLPAAAAAEEPTDAAAIRQPPPVEVSSSGPNLVIDPQVSGIATSVYVSCADRTYIHREFEGVGTALVDLIGANGGPVADGRCKYEVYVHPPVDREAMRLAEEAGDWATVERLSRIEQKQTVIHRGRFQVEDGTALVVGPEESAQ